jgi:hypothetical protein
MKSRYLKISQAPCQIHKKSAILPARQKSTLAFKFIELFISYQIFCRFARWYFSYFILRNNSLYITGEKAGVSNIIEAKQLHLKPFQTQSKSSMRRHTVFMDG